MDCLPTQQESLEPWTSREYPSLGFPAVVSGQCCLLLAPYAHTHTTHTGANTEKKGPLSERMAHWAQTASHLDFSLLGFHPVPASKELGAQINIVYNFSAWQLHTQQTGTLCASAERNNPAPLKNISSAFHSLTQLNPGFVPHCCFRNNWGRHVV